MKQEQNGRTQSESGISTAQIRVKRSVSPNGRIDSLSVEITAPIDGLDADELARRARQIIAGEAKIVEVFLGADQVATASAPSGNGAAETPARITEIGGMNTEWGRRLFLVFKVNGETARVFGAPRKLADILNSAGLSIDESEVKESIKLDVPCQVVTGRTADGRYLSIERVVPISAT